MILAFYIFNFCRIYKFSGILHWNHLANATCGLWAPLMNELLSTVLPASQQLSIRSAIFFVNIAMFEYFISFSPHRKNESADTNDKKHRFHKLDMVEAKMKISRHAQKSKCLALVQSYHLSCLTVCSAQLWRERKRKQTLCNKCFQRLTLKYMVHFGIMWSFLGF